MKLLKKIKGMNIVGQGGKIILFAIPAVILAIILPLYIPKVTLMPIAPVAGIIIAILLLIPGCTLWITAVIQLLAGFPKGKLMTRGAYGVCRNPIYSSFILFILPAISFLTRNWVYFIVSLFLWLGVVIFIKKEEKQLQRVFGKEYVKYTSQVSRIMPYTKPRK